MRSWWSRKWLLWLVLFAMTGGRCHRRKKMMGRGADGDCGTDERPCRPISRVPACKSHEGTQTATKKQVGSLHVDLFSQARKALCERSPFDVPEDGSASSSLSVCTLPSALASLLKQSDSRKKHKKSHSGNGKKSSRASERSKGGNIWDETEEDFRELESTDIDTLSSSITSSVTSKCLLIPYIGNEETERTGEAVAMDNSVCPCSSVIGDTGEDGKVNGSQNEDENVLVEKAKANQENEWSVQVDHLGAQGNRSERLSREGGRVCSVPDSSIRIEWFLGCRSRILLRPSKKRKVLGNDAGLEKIFAVAPCAGNTSLCNFCCKMGSDSIRLIVCSSCKVAVHPNCYGVQGDVDDNWLCSWCKQKTDGNSLVKQPCVLCPKLGGALKPVASEIGVSKVEFAHLFCSLWSPEVYIEDLLRMEPIMNVREMKEGRRKSVCNVCKMKCGPCVRCCHGSCRTSFHPMCAREARHKMEVWGKYGYDNVELRAFCSKHSECSDNGNASQLEEPSIAASNDSPDMNCGPADKQQKFNIGCNGDKVALHVEIPEESGDADELACVDISERNDNEGDSLNFAVILKKLIDRGKVKVKDIASEIGITPDSLVSLLEEGSLVSNLQCKVIEWLRNNAYLGILHKNMKVGLKSTILSMGDTRIAGPSDCVAVLESDVADPVSVMSVPPRRRAKSNIRTLRDDKVMCTAVEVLNENGVVTDDMKEDHLVTEEEENSSRLSIYDASEKNHDEIYDSQASLLPESEGNSHNPLDGCTSERVESACTIIPKQSNLFNEDIGYPVYPRVLGDLLKMKPFSSYYLHPSIHQKLLQMQTGMLLKDDVTRFKGSRGEDTSHVEASSSGSVSCNQQDKCGVMCGSDGVNSEKLLKAEELGVLELSPADEVEGEIIYFQHRLLANAVARKHFTDNLISNVSRSLPKEIDAARGQRWDAVLANQYFRDLREAKKLGRKERKHKEAQAVLAAATAAAASSSRISSFRKDGIDESSPQERYGTSNGRTSISSQMMSRPKETLSRVAVPRSSSEKYSDFATLVSDFSKEQLRSCDICRRSETILNPILVCSSCKVAVHLDCYRSVTSSKGPWYCELCAELLLSNNSGALPVNSWEKPCAECSLCGGSTGAFRKSADGQWVHAFCAEWIFEPTFRRGQVNPVEGKETVAKGIDICCVCHQKHGVCLKCSYGHCQTTFHPICARNVNFYMNVKTLNDKLQHKAYCKKHGAEQKAKAETPKHGVEELKSIKQVRVELERLRLLCERIVRREKIKRDLVLCSHSILGYKRDQIAHSILVRSTFFPSDVSSESATTSLKGNTEDYRSCSDPIQRSDDITVDSTISVKQHVKAIAPMDPDQKTEDSFTSQSLLMRKPADGVRFGGKQIPQRAYLTSRNVLDDGEWSSRSRKRFETFEKEMVMTSDQASMKNQQLPKGYFYIPVDCLPKEKQVNEDVFSGEPLDRDG